MKRTSLAAAAAVVLVANLFALLHAWRNRSGPVDYGYYANRARTPQVLRDE